MTFKQGKTCPICLKEHLFHLSDHLRQVHKLSSEERRPWLKSAIFSPTQSHGLPFIPSYPFFGMQHCLGGMGEQIAMGSSQERHSKLPKMAKVQATDCLETQVYPEFMFQHMFSMLVVGPSQCGKTYFVQQLLTKNCIDYPEKKPLQIYWFYNQWQPRYEEIKQVLKKKIQFAQGLPELSEDLHEINPEFHNILVFDDLMAQATDSPVLSRLFTQGRHRNASVILLLQNMFPKGKFNTDISRNALYKVLFRSPGDRKQIDIMAEQTFAKDRANFMKAYTKETEKPFGYIILDNHPRTSNEHQVVADVFGNCYTYPYITKTDSPTPQSKVLPKEQPKLAVKRKDQFPAVKRITSVKRKAEQQAPSAKKQKNQKQPTVEKKTAKKQTVKLIRKKRPATKKVKQPSQPKEKFTGGFQDEEDLISDDEFNSGEEIHYCTQEELNQLALSAYRVGNSRGGFGPRFA